MRRGHRLFAALYDVLSAPMERKHLSQHRCALLGRAAGRVLEVGAGTGANFAYYAPGLTVVATEPDTFMLRRAAAKAPRSQARILLVQAECEHLPFGDGTFDTVIATLVLCSVVDPHQALGEIRRVLRPGGRLLFYEHVRAPAPGWQRVQDALTPLWRRIGAGCHPNRDTVRSVQQAGFIITDLERFEIGPYPVRPQVRGVAHRSY